MVRSYSGSCSDVGNLNDASLEDRPSADESSAERSRELTPCRLPRLGCEVVIRNLMNQFAVEPVEVPEHALTQPYRASQDGVEHRLDIGRRTRDHPQDPRRRRLLLERLRQLSVSTLQLLNSRTFSIAMTAWAAKVWSRAICLAEKGLGLGPPIDEDDA